MKRSLKLTTFILILSLMPISEASAQFWKRKARINANTPINVEGVREPDESDETATTRKQRLAAVRAALKRGQASVETAQGNLDAANKSEEINRAARLKAKTRYEAARLAHEANPSPQTAADSNQALAEYLPVREKHLAALSMRNAAKARLNQLKGFQAQAVGAIKVAEGVEVTNNRPGGRPRFNRAAQFVRPVSAYDRVPAPRQIYSALRPEQNYGSLAPETTNVYGAAPRPQNLYNPAPLAARSAPVQDATYAAAGAALEF